LKIELQHRDDPAILASQARQQPEDRGYRVRAEPVFQE